MRVCITMWGSLLKNVTFRPRQPKTWKSRRTNKNSYCRSQPHHPQSCHSGDVAGRCDKHLSHPLADEMIYNRGGGDFLSGTRRTLDDNKDDNADGKKDSDADTIGNKDDDADCSKDDDADVSKDDDGDGDKDDEADGSKDDNGDGNKDDGVDDNKDADVDGNVDDDADGNKVEDGDVDDNERMVDLTETTPLPMLMYSWLEA